MTEKIIASVFVMLTLLISVYGCTIRNIHNNRNNKHTVCQPDLILYFGVAMCTFTSLLCLYFSFIERTLWAVILSSLIGTIGVLLIQCHANCRIEYDNEGFTYKNFWGIKRYFTYNKVTAVKGADSADASITIRGSYRRAHTVLTPASSGQGKVCPVIIYAGKKRIRIDESAFGKEAFLKHLQNKYKQLHNGSAIPIISEKEKKQPDLFKGNIKNSNQFLIAIIIMLSLTAILGVVLYLVGTFSPDTLPSFNPKENFIIVCMPFLFTLAISIIFIFIGRNAPRIDRRIVTIFFREEYLNF